MKKLLLILMLTVTFSTFAQQRGNGDRIKALKIAFITERLQLTETEAQQFWPIYNSFDEENQKLRRESLVKFKDFDFESLSESEAKSQLQDLLSDEDKKHQLRQQFIKDLMKVLPAKKILLLKNAEDDFKRRMMERLKNRREGFRKEMP